MNDIDKIIAAAKEEILEDITNGVAPYVTEFEELHDYVDANEYGMHKFEELYEDIEDNFEFLVETFTEVQNRLDKWIKGGYTVEEAN